MTAPSPWPAPDPNPLPGAPSVATLFPAAATPPAGDQHPTWCACRTCTDQLVTAVSRPLVPGGARRDIAEVLGTRDGAR